MRVVNEIPLLVYLGLMGMPCLHAQADKREAHFETKVRPVLVAKCLQCHGEAKQEGGLRLDSLAGLLEGGESGPAVEPGKPGASLLMEAIMYEGYEMPPTGQLPEKTIQEIAKWIEAGAVWPASSETLRPEAGGVTAADRQWWAFQPVRAPELPRGEGDDWSQNEIDRFVRERLEDLGMRPAAEAERQSLVRRVYLDVVGIPPTPQEMDLFLNDPSQHAWEALVDRLLDDERYGEHWARYWLDLVRYSESDGWNQDAYRPHIWRYRDYVVNALNNDMPYSDFVRQQLAGDEIEEDNPQHLAAAGYLRLGIYEYNQRDARGHWNDIMNEMTDVTGDVFLGLSMQCARCHDHKFDPIPQRDYFKLRAFFEPVIWRDDLVAATEAQQREYAEKLAVWEAATAELRAEMDALLEPYYERKWLSTVDKFPLDIQACFHMPQADRTSWQHQMSYLVSRQFMEEGGGPLKDMKKEDKEKHEDLEQRLAEFNYLKPEPLPPLTTATDFDGICSPTRIPDKADASSVLPGFLSVMSPSEVEGRAEDPTERVRERESSGSTDRRTALAKWIGDPQNPLTTRVIVNRVWQQHFGQGLVATSSDFGTNGSRPTHPELLDWLTARFVEDGWSLKKLHKRILMSATWKQSASQPHAAEYQALDPGEELLWRARVRRLQAEQIRDAMLSASGELNVKVGGPSVDEQEPRRGLYVKSFRNQNDTFMHGFDIANGLKSVAVRDSTTTPTQALLLINGEYALQRAKRMAERLEAMEPATPEETIREAFRLAWSRDPDDAELHSALEFVRAQPGEDYFVDSAKLVDFCHVLFNSNQFLYVE